MYVFVNLCNEFQKMVFMIIINQQKQKKKINMNCDLHFFTR